MGIGKQVIQLCKKMKNYILILPKKYNHMEHGRRGAGSAH